VPDWTYVPLRRSAAGAYRSHDKSRNAAMRFIRRIARVPGGHLLIRSFDYTHDHRAAGIEVDAASRRPGVSRSTSTSAIGFVRSMAS